MGTKPVIFKLPLARIKVLFQRDWRRLFSIFLGSADGMGGDPANLAERRMLDYWARFHRQYDCFIEQVMIYLKRTQSPLVFEDRFQFERTVHCYRVIRLWEVEASLLLHQPFLLPLAVLANAPEPEALLAKVARQVDIIDGRAERIEVAACVQLLAGINFDETLINVYLKEELMQESVVYQRIVAECRLG